MNSGSTQPRKPKVRSHNHLMHHHRLPGERAVSVIDRAFAGGAPSACRSELHAACAHEVSWDDELALVRSMPWWLDNLLSLLVSHRCLVRERVEGKDIRYVRTELWDQAARQVLAPFRHRHHRNHRPTPENKRLPRNGRTPADYLVHSY